jgi:hypothetical protein
MNKGIIVFAVLFVIFLVLAYNVTHSYANRTKSTTTIAPKHISPSNTANNSTSTIPAPYVGNCSYFTLNSNIANSVVSGLCAWNGGLIGLWVAGGNTGSERVIVIGADKKTYINQTSTYTCEAFYENATLPAQTYNVILRSGQGGGKCGNAVAELNTTTVPPATIRSFIYNGDFGTGTFAGWNVTGKGFGTAPLNLSYANMNNCYIGQPWTGYNGIFFATTFDCGVATAPGNLTSSPFIVNITKPFLNFRIVSPEDQHIYVEVLAGNVPRIIARYNTYNTSISTNASSMFMNVSLDLGQSAGQIVRIRVASSTLNQLRFVAVGDFSLASRPVQQFGIITNVTYNYT